MTPFTRWIGALAVMIMLPLTVSAQDFRSAASNNWNALSTWQQSTDGGSTWVPATSTPTNASGAITVRSPHTVTVTANVNLDDVTIEAGGTVSTTTGGTAWVIANGTFGVKIFGTFNAGFGGGSFGCCGSVSVENGGVVNMNSGGAFFGPTTVQAGGTVNGNTPINLAAGTVVNNGTWTMNGSNALTNSAGGTFTNNGTLTLQGFTVGGTFTNNNAASWSSGAIGGAGSFTNASGATLTIGTTNGKTLNSTFTNNGTIIWSGGPISGSGNFQNTSGAVFNIGFTSADQLQVPFTNQAGATVNQNGAGTFNTYAFGSFGTFTNAGTINLVNGNWLFNNTFTNSGTIDIPAGRTITFNSTTSLNPGTTFSGSGSIIGNANVGQNFPWTNTTHSFTLSAGTWTNGAGNPTVFGVGSSFNWTGGALAGAGNYTVQAGLTVALSTNQHTLNSVLTNNGTINWSSGNIVGSGNMQNNSGALFNINYNSSDQLQVPFTNQAGATVNQNGTGTFNTYYFSTLGVFTNAGTINLLNGNWLSNNTFTNSGTIEIPAGRLITFNSSTTTNLNAGTTITGTGSITSSGTTNQSFPWTNTTHALTISNGAWNNSSGSPLVFGVGSQFNWTGGTLAGAGNYSVQNGMTITLSTNQHTLNSVLTNNGTINWNAGNIGGSGNIQNTSGALFNINYNSSDQLQVPFTNQTGASVNQNGNGTFNTYYFSTYGVFTNAGTINLFTGNWLFNNTSIHSATSTITIAASRTLTFNTATTIAGTVSNAGTLAGTITAFTGPSFTNNGSVTLGNLPFAGSSAQTLDGTGSISSLTINNANGVTLGGTQTVTGTLTLTNGRITLGNNDLILSNTALGGLAGTVNATNRIVTNGTGAFHRQIPAGGSNYPFPIGTASSYLPATLSNTSGPAERFGARVQNEVYSEYGAPGVPTGDLVVNDQVERTWVITEATEGGNQATVQLQWNTADEGTNFGRSNCALHTYNGTDWVAGALGAASGSNPYTRSLAGVSGFREFTVADGESNMPFACPGGVTLGSPCDDGSACTTNDVIGVDCQCAGIFQDSDNDGTCNAEDGCPNDVNKTAPGACGCGVADVPASYYVDADGDGYGTGALVPGFFTCVVPPGYAAVNGDCDDANPNAHTDAAPLQPVIAVIGSDFCPGATLQLVTDRSLPVAGPGSGSPYGQSALNTSPSAMPSTTWEAWVYPAATSGVRQTIMSNDDGSFDRTVTLEGSNFGVFTGSGVWQPVAATIGQWQHIAVVFSGNTMRFYKNGTEYVYGSNTNFGTTVALFAVGRNPTAAYANELFNGRIDEVRVWNMARTQAQIQAYRTLDIDPSSPGLAALWKMNEKSGNSIPSSVPGNAYPLTFTGTLSTDFPTSFNAGNTYAWSPATGLSAPAARYTSLTVTNAQEYTLNVTTPCGQSAPPASIQIDLSPESTPWFADTDNDGYGNPDSSMQSCTQPSGYVADNTDCDDTNVNIHPGATEACNGMDDNCDGTVDEGVTPITYYADADGDGAGDPAVTATSCTGAPDGFVANNSDQCPTDPLKITQGQCNCGNPDTDSDGDTTADCADGCPNDPLKTAPGQCGCGNADTDTDNDGIADCVDTCPGVSGQIGSACDDGLATTGNDVLDNACECHGQLIDCLGVPGGTDLPGTVCTVSNLPGIWSASCVCELEGPDVAVQNVIAPNDTIAPEQTITLSWQVANLGNAAATVNWTERFYMESATGQNRTFISQAAHSSGTPLAASNTLARSRQVAMPALINVGDDARFVVEIVPGAGLTELPNSTANNTGTQAGSRVVRKLLKLLVPQTNITEGAVAGVPVTVQRTGSMANTQVVTINMTEATRFSFPATVTILAGQAARSFTVSANDNALLEGPIPASITASAAGFASAARNVTITDNESPALSITGLPATTGEGTSVTFQVVTSFAPTSALQVFLTSSDNARFPVPASVTIAANTTSANVSVTLPQDLLPELNMNVTITAGAANHAPATASLALTDDDVPGLTLVLQTDTVSESGGAFAVQATLQRTPGSSPIAFTALLTPSMANTLILPASISLAANANQQTFTVGVIDNALVDGFRTVTINAAVQMAGCGCSAPPMTVANVNTALTVADNDGPSLSVTITPATLAEGLADAGTLRVQRNTSTATALSVNLISSDVTEMTLPASISIPIGATFLDVPITTVNDNTPDGSQQVYVEASASGFAPGITWGIITDINQPDLVVTALSASTSPWAALVPITWQATIGNTGFANSIVGTTVRGVLSQNNIVDAGDIVLFNYTINTPVVAGANVQISGAAVTPNVPGSHKLLIKVNPDAGTSELTYTNNTSQPLNVSINPSYMATAQVAGTSFLRGTTIPVTGTATRPDASPAANAPVEVYVLTNGLRREVLTTTNATGQFTASFVPLANESGHYTIGASFPGIGQTTTQDAFDILGVRINDGQYPQFVTLIDDTITGTLTIENLSDAPLTNLTLVPSNVPAGAVFTFGTIPSLAGGAATTINYSVSGTVLTSGYNYAPATLQVTSDQGNIQTQDAYYYCQAPGGLISADISSINTTVSQQAGQQLIQIHIVNSGAGSTGALSLSLPQVDWLSAMTPVNMPSITPGDTALVILRFQALTSVPFDLPITGTIALNGTNSNSLVLPFTFTKVSTTVGALTVDAVNQFTFFDQDEPHVEGATVEVRHAYTNVLLASGTTDANGHFTTTGVPEGTHRLVVTKAQHLPTEQMITINPGASVSQTVFLNYQAITFSWTVVPTGVQDQYDVQLVMQFETNIPIPVVTIDMPDTMPQLFGSEVYAFNVTLTNHGLINAEEVTINLPTDDPEYEFITNYVPMTIAALQSIQIPVLMRLREEQLQGAPNELDVAALSDFFRTSGPEPSAPVCKEEVVIFWKYHCNETTGIWERNGDLFSFLNRVCEDDGPGILDGVGFNPSVFGNGFPECPFCPDPISTAGFTHPDSVRLIYNKNCKECLADLAGALGDCLGGAVMDEIGDAADDAISGASDVLDVLTSGVHEEFGIEPPDPLGDIRKNACVESYGTQNPARCTPPEGGPGGGCLSGAIAAGLGCSNLINTGGREFRESLPQALVDRLTELRMANDAYMHRDSIAMEYYSTLFVNDEVMDFRNLIANNIEGLLPIGTTQRAGIQAALAGSTITAVDIDHVIDRWNLSIEAYNAGVFAPNGQYPDIVNWTKIDLHQAEIDSAISLAVDLGYTSVWELFVFSVVGIAEVLTSESNSVCASVTVQLSQTVTMTREAFRGTLDVFNGHPTDALDSLTVNIVITDPDGVPSNGLFQINTEQLTNLSDVTGTGMIPSQEHGIVQFLFIPEPGAAPTEPVLYGFGGSVTYWDPYNEEMTTIELADVTLTVNPSPDLMLHYFMERNILGDDALTSPDVEPSIPAELAVMVENDGYGPAVNMTISSAQPEIVENESGLAINFELTGSNLQGQPAQLGVLNIPFGTIPPLSTRIGQWWFTSSLLGKFVSYEASVVHANSFGNPELSLIQGVELHELTRSIREYGGSGDAMNDFLVNDQFDVNDVPDIIYFSQGNRTAEVIPAGAGNFDMPVQPPTFANTLTLSASEPGWNYLKLNDPGNGDYDLVSVTRQDGQSIPLDNAWLTFVTLPVSQQPVYENKFHIVDSLASTSPTTYAVVWAPKNTDVPAVDTIQGAPLTITATQVDHLTVVFDKAIDPGTFTVDDLTLTFQGGPDIMSSSAIITQLDAFSFDVDLTALTVGNGQYTFIAQAAGVTDVFGISGVAGKQVSWTQFISVPAIVAFQGLPGGTTDNAFTTVDLLFNLAIDETSLTTADISITLNGVPQAGALAITRTNNDSTLFQVAGLANVLTADGSYQLTVDMPNVLSNDGEPGMQAQSIALTLDNSGPTVAQLTPSTTGGLDAQHRTGVLIRFSEPVSGLNTGAVQFTRDGQNLPLNIAQLSQVDADEWQVTGFGLTSYPDGDYGFTVSASSVTDAIGNAGTGSLNALWTVDRSTPITVTGVNIDPDLGISNSDGLTSTTSFDALFNLSEDAAQVTISQTSFGSEQILATLQNVTAGSQAVPVTFPTGGNTGLKVTAIGANGGNAFGTKDLFIDQTPLSALWQTANDQSLTADLSSATVQFSADLLDAALIDDAITFHKDGSMLPTGALTITPVNGSTYAITGLASVASGTGSYVLALDASVLHKASSGIAGQGTATLSWTVVPAYTALLRARVFLEGPYSAGVMSDALRQLSGFPLTEPFTDMGYVHSGNGGGETTTAPVLAIPGNDAIVDWVVVELRDADDNSEVVASASALLQRDGDVVAMDGLSAVNMAVAAGSYHVAIRHRNHLGTMTEDTVAFASGAVNVDFTSLSTDLFGTEPQKQIGARHALWAGDVSFDNEVQYTGSGNDRDPILVTIGGTTPNHVIYGYQRADVNMDGAVKYTGTANDRDRILLNVGSTTPTNIREGQLP